MAFKIDNYLDVGTTDEELRKIIVRVHDELHAAYRIVDSVLDDIERDEYPGVTHLRSKDEMVLAVFKELRKSLEQFD